MTFRFYVVALLFVLAIVGMGGCSRAPVERGHSDLESLGVGIARELSVFLADGDRVVVFTTPGALGQGAEAERAAVNGLADSLKSRNISVLAVEYRQEDIDAFYQQQTSYLIEAFAAGPMERAGGRNAQAFVSFAGWPNAAWLPANSVLAAVDWNPAAVAPRWKDYRAIILVAPKAITDAATAPERRLHQRPEQALAWFDQRFDVEVRTR
ncbi:MAG TPA: hypothetical protein PKE26_09925 [Kiritimatiellia bacterium]|nr:hypothetical protein [Kiritimatiellia bacterium]HMO99415.1 hypothetical protein [Kiritimatiellia bacterium]HMP96822.1 hypothetical protein [Kiritimatiellia bacterium]